jgi:hypothetical protein
VGRAVRILLNGLRQEPPHRILPDVILESFTFQRVPDPAVEKAGLPRISFDSEVPVQLKRKSTFRKLHGSFQSDAVSDQMKVVGHDHELMQKVSLLRALPQQNLDKKVGDFVDLKQAFLL